jgi:hypothetical protein
MQKTTTEQLLHDAFEFKRKADALRVVAGELKDANDFNTKTIAACSLRLDSLAISTKYMLDRCWKAMEMTQQQTPC